MMCCLGVDVLWDVRGECGGGIRARVGADDHGRHLGLGQQLGQSAGPGAHASCAHSTAHLLAGRQEYQTGERQNRQSTNLFQLPLGVSFCLVWQTVINRVFRLESAMLVLKINKLYAITNKICSQILLRISPNLVEPLPVNLESTVSLGGFPVCHFLIALSVLTIWRKITFRYFKKSATSNKSEWRNSI